MRQCAGCGRRAPQAELIRIVRTPQGMVGLAAPGRQGRSVYLCGSLSCLGRARKGGRAERRLGKPIPPQVWEQVAEQLRSAIKDQ